MRYYAPVLFLLCSCTHIETCRVKDSGIILDLVAPGMFYGPCVSGKSFAELEDVGDEYKTDDMKLCRSDIEEKCEAECIDEDDFYKCEKVCLVKLSRVADCGH